jgi:hypothetical protein
LDAGLIAFILWLTSDCMVEDEDTDGASAAAKVSFASIAFELYTTPMMTYASFSNCSVSG